MKTQNKIIDLDELANFLVEAKKNAYAGNGEYITLPDGSKQFVFIKENSPLYFTDNYKGHHQFAGSEKVEIGIKGTEHPETDFTEIWRMNYFGGMSPILAQLVSEEEFTKSTNRTYDFLKRTLSQVTLEMPFRGPKEAKEMDLRYKNMCKGDIKNFHGTEKISFGWSNTILYELNYQGGIIIPK